MRNLASRVTPGPIARRALAALMTAVAAFGLMAALAGAALAASTCPYCGHAGRLTYGWDADDTHYGTFNRIEPTCEWDGNAGIVCTNPACAEYGFIVGETMVPALGHNMVLDSTTATCLEGGDYVDKCTRCGITESGAMEALGHRWVTTTTEATCEEDGSEVTRCSRCGQSRTVVLPALGHDMVGESFAPTCTEPGEERGTCSRCGLTDPVEVPALGHDFLEEWTVVTEATEGEEGLEQRVCKRCGEVEEQVIPALPVPEPADPSFPWVPVAVGVGVVAAGAALAVVLSRRAAATAAKTIVNGLVSDVPDFDGLYILEKGLMHNLPEGEMTDKFLKAVKKLPNIAISGYDAAGEMSLEEAALDAGPDVLVLYAEDAAAVAEALRIADGLAAEAEAEVEPVPEPEPAEPADPEATAEAETEEEPEPITVSLIVAASPAEVDGLLQEAKKDGRILGYAYATENAYVQFTKTVLPMFKDTLKDANSLENVGTITDMLGIPGVSLIVHLVANGERAKDIAEIAKESLANKEFGFTDGVDVLGAFSEMLGFDGGAAVADLISYSGELKESLTESEDGAGRKAFAGKNVVDALTDVVSEVL